MAWWLLMAWWLDVSGHIHTFLWIVAKVAWGIAANHGGGYQYRLCPASEDPTEECFQKTPLEFVGEVSWMSAWYNFDITVTYCNCQFFVRFILGVAGEWWFHFSGTTCHKVISKIVYWSDFHMFLFQCFSWKLLKTKQLRINGSNLATAMMLHNASPWKPVESGVRSLAPSFFRGLGQPPDI